MFLKYRHKFRLTIIYNTNAGQLFYSLELLQGYLILKHGTNFIICPMVRYTGNFWNLVAPTSGSGVRAPNVKTRLSQKRLGIRDKNVKQKCSAGGIPYKSKWAWRKNAPSSRYRKIRYDHQQEPRSITWKSCHLSTQTCLLTRTTLCWTLQSKIIRWNESLHWRRPWPGNVR